MRKHSITSLQSFLLFLFLIIGLNSCKNNSETENAAPVAAAEEETPELFFRLSLAQWSLNQPIRAGEMDPMDFAQRANEMGFEGIEYVSQLYTPLYQDSANTEAALQMVLDSLKFKSEQYDVENVLIMVDGEGELAADNVAERNEAVENHKKWVDAAEFLGCHSVRVNLFGSNVPDDWKSNAIDGLTKLSQYAAEKNINILVENHGYLSSNAELLVDVMEQVNMKNCGTLPDFGNFCLRREGGERWGATCVEEYPRYQGVEELMEYAKAVSAKSYDFNESGEETTIDYTKMLQIVKDAGYSGFIGVEYEGSRLSPQEGILATKQLLIEAGRKLADQQ